MLGGVRNRKAGPLRQNLNGADIGSACRDVCFVPVADTGLTMALPSAAFLPCPPWDKDQRSIIEVVD
jgi:hypothetical protein